MLTGSYRRCVRPEAAGTYLGDSSLALGGGSDREHLSGEVISSLGPEGSEVRIQPTCESWFQEMRWPNQEPVSGLWNLRVRQLVTKTEVTKKKKKKDWSDRCMKERGQESWATLIATPSLSYEKHEWGAQEQREEVEQRLKEAGQPWRRPGASRGAYLVATWFWFLRSLVLFCFFFFFLN